MRCVFPLSMNEKIPFYSKINNTNIIIISSYLQCYFRHNSTILVSISFTGNVSLGKVVGLDWMWKPSLERSKVLRL